MQPTPRLDPSPPRHPLERRRPHRPRSTSSRSATTTTTSSTNPAGPRSSTATPSPSSDPTAPKSPDRVAIELPELVRRTTADPYSWAHHGIPTHPRPAAVRLRRDRRAEDGSPASRRGRDRPRVRQPGHPVAADRGREAGRGGAEPAQPPVLRRPAASRACGSRSPTSTGAVRRRARPRDRGVRHHRRQGGLLPPHVGAARPGRHRAGAEPVVPDPHLGPDPRRRRRALRAAWARTRTSSPTCTRRGSRRGRGRASS